MNKQKSVYNDSRLDQVYDQLASRIVAKKTVCLKKLANTRSEEVQFGRFLRNPKVCNKLMINEEIKRTRAQVANRHVLAIMDTTELNFQHHPVKASCLGTVGNGIDKGIFVHPTMVLDALNGGGIGFSAMKTWNRRKQKSDNYPTLPIEEKESFRWLEASHETVSNLDKASFITIIADRESDIYQLWDRIPNETTALLIRGCRDRRLDNGQKLSGHAESLPARDTRVIKIRSRLTRKSRKATLQVRYGKVNILKPKTCIDPSASSSVEVNLVYVKESNCPAGEKPIVWILLTTHDVNSADNAWQIVDWYKERWQIEQLFRTIKSKGLDIESSHLETERGIENLSVMALIAAFRVMQLTLARDGDTEQKTQDIFTSTEIELLDRLRKKYEGKTEKQKNPYTKNNLAWASWVIARLGGWKGYASEGPPGPITMKYGLEYFEATYRGWMLAKDVCIA